MVGWLWSVANIIAARFECVATFSTRGSFSTTLHQEPVEVDTRQLGMESTACRHRTIPDRPIAAIGRRGGSERAFASARQRSQSRSVEPPTTLNGIESTSYIKRLESQFPARRNRELYRRNWELNPAIREFFVLIRESRICISGGGASVA